MKRLGLILVTLLLTTVVMAQSKKEFSPEKFDAALTAYVVQQAKLNQKEADALIPLMKQMHSRMRSVYRRLIEQRKVLMEHPNDEAACRKALKERDKLNIELKTIEGKFHDKMVQVAPASKVLAATEAEDRFFRRMMKGWQMQHRKRAPKQ